MRLIRCANCEVKAYMMKTVFYVCLFLMIGGAIAPYKSAIAQDNSHVQQTKKFGVPPFYNTKKSAKALSDVDDFSQDIFMVEDRPIQLSVSGHKSSPVIVFIHGSPGSWNAWADYLFDPELREKALLIAPDRPAYGGSNDGTSGLSLEEQSRLIMGAIKQRVPQQKKFILVGHSYGGPLALRMAIDYPDAVQSMLLLAPAISPELVRRKWYNWVADLLLVRAILPSAVHHSNEEMIPLKGELIKMEDGLETITAPTTVIQGEKDNLVHVGNADFAIDALINADVEAIVLPQRGHFIPWHEYGLVKQKILKYLGQSK